MLKVTSTFFSESMKKKISILIQNSTRYKNFKNKMMNKKK